MNKKLVRSIVIPTAFVAVGLALANCSGGTDGDNAGDISLEDQFTGGAGKTGDITLSVVNASMDVSDTSGFGVKVVDAQGRPVSGIKISCDSEDGVAIIEPTTGSETTDSSGNISGVIGCQTPGSYQFACRLPVGGNQRELVTIRCAGPVPTGFDGFPGAGGGGLGGGSDNNDNDSLRITDMLVIDNGEIASDPASVVSFSVDVVQGNCAATVGAGTPAPTPDPEPFFDTVIAVKVENNTNQTVTCSSAEYSVAGAGALANSGTSFVSDSLSLLGDAAVDGSGDTNVMRFLAFDVVSGAKRFAGSSTDIPDGYGFKSVTVTLNCENDDGEEITLEATQTLSFDNFNRCD
jgi:hypothetical protein